MRLLTGGALVHDEHEVVDIERKINKNDALLLVRIHIILSEPNGTKAKKQVTDCKKDA